MAQFQSAMSTSEAWNNYLSCQSDQEKKTSLINFLLLYLRHDEDCKLEQFCDPISAKNLLVKEFIIEVNGCISQPGDEGHRQFMKFLLEGRAASLLIAISIMLSKDAAINIEFYTFLAHMVPQLCITVPDLTSSIDLLNWIPDTEKSFISINSNASFISKLTKQAQGLFYQRYSTKFTIRNSSVSFVIDNNQRFHLLEVCLIVFSVLSQLGMIAVSSEPHQLGRFLVGLCDVNLKIINDLRLPSLTLSYSHTVTHLFSYRLCLRVIYSLSSSVWSLAPPATDEINILKDIINFAKLLVSGLNENRHILPEQPDYAVHLSLALAEIVRGMLNLTNHFMSLNMKRQDNAFSKCIFKLLIENEFFQLFSQSFSCIDNVHRTCLSNRDDTKILQQFFDAKSLETHLIRAVNTLKITVKSVNVRPNAFLQKKIAKDSLKSMKNLSKSRDKLSIYNLGDEETKNYFITELISSTLLHAFCECQHDDLLCYIISAIMDCKVAFYVSLDELYKCLLDKFSTRSLRGQTNILNLLNFTLLIEWDAINKHAPYNEDSVHTNLESGSIEDRTSLITDGFQYHVPAVSYYKNLLYILKDDSLKLLLKHLANLLSHGSESLKVSILQEILLPVFQQDVTAVSGNDHKLVVLECLKLVPLCLYNSKGIQERFICLEQFYKILGFVDDTELCESCWMILEFLCLSKEFNNSDPRVLNDIEKCKVISVMIGKIDDSFVKCIPLQLLQSIDNQITLQDRGVNVAEDLLNRRINNEDVILLAALWNSYWKLYRSCPKFREMFTTFKLTGIACKCLGYVLACIRKNIVRKESDVVSGTEKGYDQVNTPLQQESESSIREADTVSSIDDELRSYSLNDTASQYTATHTRKSQTFDQRPSTTSDINWKEWLLFDNVIDCDVGLWELSDPYFKNQVNLILNLMTPLLGITIDCKFFDQMLLDQESSALDSIMQEILPLFYQLSSLDIELDPDISYIMLQISVNRNSVVKCYSQQEMIKQLASEFQLDSRDLFHLDAVPSAPKMSYTDDDYEADVEFETEDYCTTDASAAGDNDEAAEITYISQEYDELSLNERLVPIVMHPDITMSAVKILAYRTNLMLCQHRKLLHRSIETLLMICNANEENKLILCEMGLIKVVLNKYYCILSMGEPFEDVQQSLYKLLSMLASYSISTTELRTMFYLMQNSKYSEKHVVEALHLAVSSFQSRPLHFLSFPFINKDTVLHVEERDKDVECLLPWNLAPVQMPLEGQFVWPNTSGGFTITLWIKTNYRQVELFTGNSYKPKGMSFENFNFKNFHILSIGSPKALFEVWTWNKSLTLRWTISDTTYEVRKTVEEYHLDNVLRVGEWQQFTIAYSINEEIFNQGWIRCWENGVFLKKVPFMIPEIKKSTLCNLLTIYIGHTTFKEIYCRLFVPAFNLGNVLLFYDKALSHEEVLHLYAMGPDSMHIFNENISQKISDTASFEKFRRKQTSSSKKYYNMDKSDDKNLPSDNWASIWYSKALNSKTLKNSEVQLSDYFLGSKYVSSTSLQECLLAAFYPRNLHYFSQYLLPKVDSGSARSPVILEKRDQIQKPISLTIAGRESWLPTFYAAIYPLGGLSTLLYMFADAVERDLKDDILASVLSLLFGACRSDFYFANEMMERNGYLLLQRVFLTMKGISYKILKVVLNAACSETFLEGTSVNDYQIIAGNAALIRDVHLIHYLLLECEIWLQSNIVVWEIFMRSLIALVSTRNPHQWFNIQRLKQAKLIELFFLTIQEQQQDGFTQIPAVIIEHYVTVIDYMLGSPPDTYFIEGIFDFLLAVHPFIDARVKTHRTESYYCDLGPLYATTRVKVQGRHKIRSKSFNESGDRDVSSLHRTFSDPFLNHFITEEFKNLRDNYSRSVAGDIKFNVNGEGKLANTSYNDEDLNIRQSSYGECGKASEFKDDDALVSLKLSLLQIMDGILLNLPDARLESILGQMIHFDTLLILANTPSLDIRTAIVKLLYRYFERSNEKELLNFNVIHGFHLLARQLYGKDPDFPLVNGCFSILLNSPVDIQQRRSLPIFNTSQKARCLAVVPILSLLENCFVYPSLLIATLTFMNDIFSAWSDLIEVAIENGLTMTLCKVIRLLNVYDESKSEITNSEFECIGQCVLRSLFIVSHFSCSSSNDHSIHYLEDLVALLCKLYKEEKIRAGRRSNAALYIKSVRYFVLKCAVKSFWHWEQEAQESDLNLKWISDGFVAILHDTMKKEEVPVAESANKFRSICVLCTNLIIATSGYDHNGGDVDNFESQFISSVFKMLMNCSLNDSELLLKDNFKVELVRLTKDVARMQFQRLLLFLLSPSRSLNLTKLVLIILEKKGIAKRLFSDLSNSTLKLKFRGILGSYLRDLRAVAKENNSEDLLHFCNIAEECGVSLKGQTEYSINDDQFNISWLSKQDQICFRLNERFSILDEKASKSGEAVAERIGTCMNAQIKKFLKHLHHKFGRDILYKKGWKFILDQVAHERTIWCDLESYPKSWELDPTEGPNRERRRLRRCRLTIPNEFFLTDRQNYTKSKFPLETIFSKDIYNSKSSSKLSCINNDDQLICSYHCSFIAPENRIEGEFLIGQYRLYFIQDTSVTRPNLKKMLNRNIETVTFSWKFEEITEIHKRRYSLHNNALEIFLGNGNTYLLSFSGSKERSEVYQLIINAHRDKLIHLRDYDEIKTTITQKWRDGKISNFHYLTQLNKIAGRSFNDLMQYPVFPFVLSNYTETTLDLTCPESFRDLSKPIAAQNEDRAKKYKENYQLLKDEYERGLMMGLTTDNSLPSEPYHYGSHYSNSGTVLHFLVRVPPYTQMFIDYQDQSFDLPDRTFHSMATTWRLSSYESTTDVKELIPEFYYLPDFIKNFEGFDFGKRQTGEKVNDVCLPPWCENNARLFILIHRQALESACVSRSINKWIDLIFGCKQTGKDAIEAINVFHPSTYKVADMDTIKDPIKRNAYLTMVNTYGQTPLRLFRNPHVEKIPQVDQGTISTIFDSGAALFAQLSRRNIEEKSKANEIIPLSKVKGLRWGDYLGSPSSPEPSMGWSSSSLKDGVITAVKYAKSAKGDYIVSLGSNNDLFTTMIRNQDNKELRLWSSLVRWSNLENVISLKTGENSPLTPMVNYYPSEQVTCSAAVSSLNLILLGGVTGVISCWSFKFVDECFKLLEQKMNFYGHYKRINCLAVCESYSIFVSGSDDRTCIIWDLNRLSYVRTIAGYPSGIMALTVSSTTGDIVAACDLGRKSAQDVNHGSLLKLCDINGSPITTCTCDYSITCLAYTNLPEGISINAVVGGLSNGNVRMWNAWNLGVLRDISLNNLQSPVVSLAFTSDYFQLFVAYDDYVQSWKKRDQFYKDPIYHHFG